MTNSKPWTQVRLRAGPLVKVLRYRRPQLRPGDLPSVRQGKNEIIRAIRDCCFLRKPVDRLEVMLALMGWGCSLYTLTFAAGTLPETLPQTRDWWKAFSKGLRRCYGGAFPYVYCIEGLHGDHRWHVHAVLRDADFSQDDVLRRWGGGHIEDVQPLLPDRQATFRDRARYLTKERRDGRVIAKGVRQWVAAPMLYRSLAPPQKRLVRSGSIRSPVEVWNLVQSDKENPYGAYRYKSWIELP